MLIDLTRFTKKLKSFLMKGFMYTTTDKHSQKEEHTHTNINTHL